MGMTAEQKAKIKAILLAQKRDTRQIVKQHKQSIIKTIEDLDAQTTEAVRRRIQAA